MAIYVLSCVLIVVLFILSRLIKHRGYVYRVFKTLPRDLRTLKKLIEIYFKLRKIQKRQVTLISLFQETVSRNPHKVAFYFEDQKWTFRELDIHTNRIAHYFKHKGLKKNDIVSLLHDNSPEYVAIWLGLAKLGVLTAFINTNLVFGSLCHCIQVAKSKALIFSSNYKTAVNSIQDSIKDVTLFEYNEELKHVLLSECTTAPEEIQNIDFRDYLCYIYTSGTTGLPKAAPLSHKRLILNSIGISHLLDFKEEDTVYNPLPLYHIAGGQLGISVALISGTTVVLRKKFSVTQYWTDCEKFGCTISLFIGEMCRYLLSAHKPGTPMQHNVTKMLGNGLRSQIWDEFIETFKIKHLYEIYGSTEGNTALVNTDNRKGSIGFLPIWAKPILSEVILRCDLETGEIIRNSNGLCIRCEDNEAGLMAVKISNKKEFLGYTDQQSTDKKIIRDVFVKGDKYFNTGDIIVQDEWGYLYFKDRTGDTFRWKGENVATNEVEDVISRALNFKDVIVLGVEIPGTEGRAGLAAIVDDDMDINVKALAQTLKSRLPAYAIPLFLRVIPSAPLTGTFKLQKTSLKKQGYNVHEVADPFYFYSASQIDYIPLDKNLYNDIIKKKIKL
ncbi:long-chain fatty acid transport protein 4-like isoform X2 [Rhynchophorus ferrugineus]